MVNRKDSHREEFVIDEDYRAEETDNMRQEEYHGIAAEVFRNKTIMPFIIGGVGLIALVLILVVYIAKPNKRFDQEDLHSLDARIQQLEKELATVGVMEQTLQRIDKQGQKFELLENKLAGLQSTVSTQIDQIIKELGMLHQKINPKKDSNARASQTAVKKRSAASKKTAPKSKFHEVQAGDTLYGISRRYGLSIKDLQNYNNLAPNAAIYPGQKLKLSPN